MDKGERLEEFMAWARDAGVDADHLESMRMLANALLDASGGGRVTESHILTVSDRYEAAGPDVLAKVTECGELFLRWEDALRQAGSGSAAPKSKMGTYLPRRPAAPPPVERKRSPSESPPDAGQPLRPPEREGSRPPARTTEPPAITFTKGNTAAPAAAPPGPPAPAPAAAGTPRPTPKSPASLPPGRRGPAGAQGQFRCPTCQVMVTPSAEGICPTCGAAPPKAIFIPSEDVPLPAAARTAGLGWIGWAALGLMAVGAAVVVVKCTAKGDPGRGESVAGEHEIDPLGVKAIFPRGWYRVAGSAEERQMAGGEVRAMAVGLFRGGDSGNPDVALLLAVLDGAVPPEAGQIIPDPLFMSVCATIGEGIAGGGQGSFELETEACERVELGLRRTCRCTGSGNLNGPRAAAFYFWLMDGAAGAALFASRGGLEPLVEEADDIVGTIENVAPVAVGAGGGEGEGVEGGEAADSDETP